jgi:hypothetical protein
MITNAQRIAARIREMRAALEARQPVHPEGPRYPSTEDALSVEVYASAMLKYQSYALGALGILADLAAQELERANPAQVAA